RDRQDVALPGRIRVFGAGNHGSQRLAFWRCVSSTAGIGTRVLALSSLLARTWTADLSVFANANAGHSILGILSIACVCTFRRVRTGRTISYSGSVCFRAFFTYVFLSLFSVGGYV